MTPGLALTVLGSICLLLAIVGWWRYAGPLNPLTIFAIDQGLVFTVFSGVVALFVDPYQQIQADAAVHTAVVSAAYFAGVFVAFVSRVPLAHQAYAKLLALLHLQSSFYARQFRRSRVCTLLLVAATAMSALAILGGGGVLWLTNSRTAYQFYRSGAGPFFSAYEWCLSFTLLYVLWSRRPRLIGTVASVFCFALLMFFSGSKGFVLLTLIIGVSYYHFLVRRIPTVVLCTLFPVLAIGALGLQLLQGTSGDLLGTVLYFRDYFAFSSEFLGRFGEFRHTYGATTFSELWAIVPRALVPSKPYVYGVIRILDVLSPGFAEEGHTAGILPWTSAYLDFGVLGVFLMGFLTGLLRRVAFEHFLTHRTSFFAFSLMVHFSLREIWLFLPLPLVFALAMLQAIFLRLVLLKTPSTLRGTGLRAPAPNPG
jgi:oligosaccharide repeat unit polymerase